MGGPFRASPPPLAMPLMAMAIADAVSNYVAIATMRTEVAVTAAAIPRTSSTACAARAGNAGTRRAATRRPASSYWRTCDEAATTPPPQTGRTQEAPPTGNLFAPGLGRTVNHAHSFYWRKPIPVIKGLTGVKGLTRHFTPGLTELLHRPTPKKGLYVFMRPRRSKQRPAQKRPTKLYLGGGNRVMMTMMEMGMARMGRVAASVLATPSAHQGLRRKRTPTTI